jgi:hypothetical protein
MIWLSDTTWTYCTTCGLNLLQWPSSFSRILRLWNKQFSSVATVCNDNLSIITYTSEKLSLMPPIIVYIVKPKSQVFSSSVIQARLQELPVTTCRICIFRKFVILKNICRCRFLFGKISLKTLRSSNKLAGYVIPWWDSSFAWQWVWRWLVFCNVAHCSLVDVFRLISSPWWQSSSETSFSKPVYQTTQFCIPEDRLPPMPFPPYSVCVITRVITMCLYFLVQSLTSFVVLFVPAPLPCLCD